jgi:uncharacterized protein YbjT (DUF2867 family)
VQRIVVVSITGTDRFTAGYGAAKAAHEKATLAGPIAAQVLHAAQLHEFVAQLVEWGTQGEVAYPPRMRTQLVAARAVAEVLADMATEPTPTGERFAEVAGPREAQGREPRRDVDAAHLPVWRPICGRGRERSR